MNRERGRGKREAYTLVEVTVVLAILSLLAGISGLALASLKPRQEAAELRELRRARAEAIRTGVAVRAHSVLFLPDGRALGPGVDPLTGAPRAAR